MTYVKHENPYRDGGDYAELFDYMQKRQTYTVKELIEFCINKLHLSEARAKYNVYAMNSPREESNNGSDPRGNAAIKGHLHYSQKLERKFVGGMKQPQYFRLRWREVPLEQKKREVIVVQEPERIVAKHEKVLRYKENV
jgi:hypothetical protein